MPQTGLSFGSIPERGWGLSKPGEVSLVLSHDRKPRLEKQSDGEKALKIYPGFGESFQTFELKGEEVIKYIEYIKYMNTLKGRNRIFYNVD